MDDRLVQAIGADADDAARSKPADRWVLEPLVRAASRVQRQGRRVKDRDLRAAAAAALAVLQRRQNRRQQHHNHRLPL